MAIPALPERSEEAYREDSKVLQAYQALYLDLVSYTAHELGRKRALVLAEKSVAGTPFAGLQITDAGMFLPKPYTSPLANFTDQKAKRSVYQRIHPERKYHPILTHSY